MAICPIIVYLCTWPARLIDEVVCDLRVQYGCAETISANVLKVISQYCIAHLYCA